MIFNDFEGFAWILLDFCRDISGMLLGFCRDIAGVLLGSLQGLYLDFAGILLGFCRGCRYLHYFRAPDCKGGTLAKIRLQGPLKVVAIYNTFELLIAKLSLFAIL